MIRQDVDDKWTWMIHFSRADNCSSLNSINENHFPNEWLRYCVWVSHFIWTLSSSCRIIKSNQVTEHAVEEEVVFFRWLWIDNQQPTNVVSKSPKMRLLFSSLFSSQVEVQFAIENFILILTTTMLCSSLNSRTREENKKKILSTETMWFE